MAKKEISPGAIVAVCVIIGLVWLFQKVYTWWGWGSNNNNGRVAAATQAWNNLSSGLFSKPTNSTYSYRGKVTSRSKAAALPTAEQARQAANTLGGGCKFLLAAKQQLQRDYILVVDRSGSMSGARWRQATEAVKTLAPQIVRFDPDGVTLILFDHEVLKFENITTAEQVNEIMGSHQPRGSTDLALALDTAFMDYFNNNTTDNPCSILVVTDGAPNDQEAVARCIVAATKAMEIDAELSVSFISIGSDQGCIRYLQSLDDDLESKYGAKFDIVDTMTDSEAKGMSFNELIARSIYD